MSMVGGSSPFTPDFGRRPHLLVGQDSLLNDVRRALSAGPGASEYTRLLLGHRGSGKTTLLSEVGDIAQGCGFVVIHTDAASSGLAERIITAVSEEVGEYESIAAVLQRWEGKRSQARLSGVGLGPFKASWDKPGTPKVGPDLRYSLLRVAQASAEVGSGVVLLVDELHAGDRDELRRLAADLQYVTKIKQLPLSFTGAGLRELAYTVLRDRKMTFLHRCQRHEIQGVDPADAWGALRRCITESGLTVNEEALQIMTDAIRGKTFYHLQSIGDKAWRIGTASKGLIDAIAAREAVREAEQDIHHRIVIPVWHDLAPSDRAVLTALARLGGRTERSELSRTLHAEGMPYSTQRAAVERLRIQHLLNRDGDYLSQMGIITASDVHKTTANDLGDDMVWSSPNSMNQPSKPGPPRCGHYMPRVKAPCVLPHGHAGKHRSRR